MSEEISQEIPEFGSSGTEKQINTYFLACDCKPGSSVFSVLDPFVYDVQPGWIFGSLGVLHYDPPIYALITVHDDSDPVFGYVMTISHPDTVSLLDRIKGFYGPEGFNMHVRNLTSVNLADGNEVLAWVYTLSPAVISSYESIEQVENGLWDQKDTKLLELEAELEDTDIEDEDDEEELDEPIS